MEEIKVDTEKKMSYEEFQPMFGAWAEKFKPFIESEEMFDIYQKIKEHALKETIVPKSENVFRAFQTTVPYNIKCIWYLMDPYKGRYPNREYQATGIAMDCSNSPTDKIQPSLEQFYKGMDRELNIESERSKSLEYLHEQGVMMLNTSLTCKLNKTGSHKGLWDPFHKFFLEEVMREYPGTIYVLCGEDSERMEKYISPLGNHIIKVDHPVSASYKNTTWDSQGVFTKINNILKEQGKYAISWDRKLHEADIPF